MEYNRVTTKADTFHSACNLRRCCFQYFICFVSFYPSPLSLLSPSSLSLSPSYCTFMDLFIPNLVACLRAPWTGNLGSYERSVYHLTMNQAGKQPSSRSTKQTNKQSRKQAMAGQAREKQSACLARLARQRGTCQAQVTVSEVQVGFL